MSYLDPLRLHFSGRFLAAPSTVNNNPDYYNNATFLPIYQTMGPGWWNPEGDSYWRFIGCQVTDAFGPDGTPAAANDPVRSCMVADSDRSTAGKLADLDSQQQLVSQVWGMLVRIAAEDGTTLMSGRFEPVAFIDLWDRWPGAGGDIPAGAMYQSVLTDLEWGEVDDSPVLSGLRAASAASGMLSIKFNVDRYDLNFQSPTFTQGKVGGTIGPVKTGEPRHMVQGRQFTTRSGPGGFFYSPAGGINWCAAVVDEARGKILLDLGNALPLAPADPSVPSGTMQNLGELSLACLVPTPVGVRTVKLGDIDYRQAGWYDRTAGVVEVPATGRLNPAELTAVRDNPLALLLPDPFRKNSKVVAISEPASGLFARADQFVFRLDAGQSAQAEVWATRFGKPLAGAEVLALRDSGGLQGYPGSPPVATPENGLTFPASVTTGPDGRAMLPLTAGDPGNPRDFIDGQVYGVRPTLAATVDDPSYPVSPWHFISVLVWDPFAGDEPPTWHGSLHPVFQQYANLYPVMKRFLDLGDYESVCANRNLLLLAFGLDPHNPNYMPAVRDLSGAKRSVILRWLQEVGADGKPLLGTPPAADAAPPAGAGFAAADEGIPVAAQADTGEGVDPALLPHGKASAAARRQFLQDLTPLLPSEQPS
jgi:hypothetical protein